MTRTTTKTPLSRDPQGPDRGAIKAMRGGSWLKPAISLRTSDRDWGTDGQPPQWHGISVRERRVLAPVGVAGSNKKE